MKDEFRTLQEKEQTLARNLESKEVLIKDLRQQLESVKIQTPVLTKPKKDLHIATNNKDLKQSNGKDSASVFSISKDSINFTPLHEKSSFKEP